MQNTSTRILAAAALAAAAALGLAACSSGSGDSGAATPTAVAPSSSASSTAGSAGMLPPIIVNVADIDGTTVDVPLGNTIDLVTASGEDPTVWTAKIADPAIAEFVPGKNDGSATFNPGITPLAVGSTDVVLSNPTTDARVSFTVNVTAAK
ncbi:hypothetical protein VD659_02050 [Herbiconiux sp. 11R-BC]|uniref:hypothetical protein n=1 Tax=Herbiconiux sp. 11R-BC TaxID=3111637 RepID=UPI003C02B289